MPLSLLRAILGRLPQELALNSKRDAGGGSRDFPPNLLRKGEPQILRLAAPPRLRCVGIDEMLMSFTPAPAVAAHARRRRRQKSPPQGDPFAMRPKTPIIISAIFLTLCASSGL